MYSKTIRIAGTDGSYDIPRLVQIGCSYDCHVMIQNNQGTFDVKSIMGMMSMDPRDGALILRADGPDEQAAVEEVYRFFADHLPLKS